LTGGGTNGGAVCLVDCLPAGCDCGRAAGLEGDAGEPASAMGGGGMFTAGLAAPSAALNSPTRCCPHASHFSGAVGRLSEWPQLVQMKFFIEPCDSARINLPDAFKEV
jgi:hypothetical protein